MRKIFFQCLFILTVSLSLHFCRCEAEIERSLLITGCARSGTCFIAKVLQQAGLDIQHEQIGRDGVSSWFMTVHANSTPWGPGRNGISFSHIFHQVRHPLKVISSVYTTEGVKSWGYSMPFIPQILPEDSYIVRSAKYWYYWNLMAAKEAELTYRVEDLANVWEEFEKRLGRKLDRKVLTTIPTDTNSRLVKPPSRGNNTLEKDFTWEDLKRHLDQELYLNIRNLAEQYGYHEEVE
jgi:hypothetical protein